MLENLKNPRNIIIIIAIVLFVGVIFAAVAPSNLNGKLQTQIEKIENLANESYTKQKEEGKTPTLSNIKSDLEQNGYTIENIITNEPIEGISLPEEEIILRTNEQAEIEVIFKENSEASKYYVKIEEKYYRMLLVNDRIEIEQIESELPKSITPQSNEYKLEANSNNLNVEVEVKESKIIISTNNKEAIATLAVKYGKYEVTNTITVIAKPSEDAKADSSIEIETKYGKVDVIWVDRNNKQISKPLVPETNLADMQEITWSYNEKTKKWEEDEVANDDWYEYIPNNEGKTRWANVKLTKNDESSYFVWIPRYAYRITYYSDENNSKITGYYDGYGMWSAKTGKKKYNLDEDIKTVEYNGNKYIVHPAFVNESNNKIKYSNGGWDKDISGIWVAKYEMSGNKTILKSVPNEISLRNMSIGEQYTAAIGYKPNYSSHMMKNSEWGAVAYLTQSQYGVSANEIAINNSAEYKTGNSSGLTANVEISGQENPYNTEEGVKSTTTGNIYGIYDLIGGAAERVATFNNIDANDNLENSGWISATGLSADKDSTKFASKYYSTETSVETEYNIGKIGDATKEVSQGTKTTLSHWFDNYNSIINPDKPFVIRGGSSTFANRASIGMFYLNSDTGEAKQDISFRVVLCTQ